MGQEDCEFKVNLGYIMRPYLRKTKKRKVKKPKPKQKKELNSCVYPQILRFYWTRLALDSQAND
jgi:hypothetical protein